MPEVRPDNEFNPYIDNLRVGEFIDLLSPYEVEKQVPIGERNIATAMLGREAVSNAMFNIKPGKLVVVTGPCSIHDPEAALIYAEWLSKQRELYGDDLEILMRMFFEKPRTIVGWKGLIYDPELDESHDINRGIIVARTVAKDITSMGVPVGTETLDAIISTYFDGLLSWGAIGARTVQSPKHRELASGVSYTVGMKNSPSGNIEAAINAIIAASHPHFFPGTSYTGKTVIVPTTGNPECHLVLRGGKAGKNYDPRSISEAADMLIAAGLRPNLMVDASHDNSEKDPVKQMNVVRSLAYWMRQGMPNVRGVMIESNLKEGKQPFIPGSEHDPGLSITDGCVGLEETSEMLGILAEASKARTS
jgi:3-deoxy-7-phosphoheptulonate synthase